MEIMERTHLTAYYKNEAGELDYIQTRINLPVFEAAQNYLGGFRIREEMNENEEIEEVKYKCFSVHIDGIEVLTPDGWRDFSHEARIGTWTMGGL